MPNRLPLPVLPWILLIFLFLLPAESSAFSDRRPAEIVLEQPDQLTLLIKMEMIIDRVIGDVVTVYVDDDELALLQERGFDIRRIPYRARIYADSLRRATRGTANPMAAYHTYEELTADLDSIASAHPTLCRLDSIGTGADPDSSRILWFMKISDNVNLEEDEPEFKYISTMHGDEPVGTEMCLYLIQYLMDNYGTDSLATFLVDETEIWIMPLMNPDGNALIRRGNANGVDLNRNFPDFVVGPPNDTTGLEPETQAIMLWEEEQTSILSANFHTGALVVNYPWDSTWDYNPDDNLFHDISLTYSSTNLPMWNNPYPSYADSGVIRGVEWYLIHGGMQDWNYYWMGCNGVTIELSYPDKWPSASTLPDFWDDNRESMLNYMARVHDGVRGLVTDASTKLPVAATVEVQGIDQEVYTDADVGDYHRMLLPGTYDLDFTAAGYSPVTVEDVVVVAESTTVVHVQMYPQVVANISGKVTETGSGTPLEASVEVLDSGFGPVSSDSATGEYTINVYEGVYTMRVSKDGYATAIRDSVIVSGSIVEDFQLAAVAEHLYASYDSVGIFDPGYITSVITVPDSFTVEDLNVFIDITHSYISDLDVELENPQGDLVYLHHRTGGSDDDIITWYDTETEPYDSLSHLMGKQAAGDWTLWVTDHVPSDSGALNQWQLQIYGGGDMSPPPAVDDLAAGLSQDVIVLSWTGVTDDLGMGHYVVYRSSDQGFEPQSSDSIGTTDSTSYVDEDSPVGNSGVNAYYLIKAVDLAGNKSSASNRVGEFDRVLDNCKKKSRRPLPQGRG
jgi:subtilisin-like proprotein convertase family protein